MLANRKNGAFYIGVTSDLVRRLQQHKNDPQGFVRRYRTYKIVWYEAYARIKEAIQRATSLKRWERAWKVELIKAQSSRLARSVADLHRIGMDGRVKPGHDEH